MNVTDALRDVVREHAARVQASATLSVRLLDGIVLLCAESRRYRVTITRGLTQEQIASAVFDIVAKTVDDMVVEVLAAERLLEMPATEQ